MPNLFNNQYANLASKGRFGDTMLAHINPQEAGLLSSMGGAGTINPQTGLREFYQRGVVTPTYQAPYGTYDMRGSSPNRPAPFDYKYADTFGNYKGSTTSISGYTVPSDDKKYAGIPLDAKFDAQGNFRFYTLKAGEYLTPDPSQPNIQSVPRISATGEVEDWGIADVNNQEGSGFGSFIGGLLEDFGPMILAGLGAYALQGSSLLTGFGGATGGVTGAAAQTLGPYAAQAAGVYGAGGAAAAATAAELAAASGTGTGLLNAGGAGGANFMSPSLISTAGGAGGAATTTASTIASQIATQGATPSLIEQAAKFLNISPETLKTFAPSAIQGLLSTAGSVLTADKATEAAKIQSEAQIRAAQIAADAARFRPVGVTTRFGSSNFTTDAAGNVVTAGYTPSAEITGYQNRLSTLANQGLTDVEDARTAYKPLTGAAQNLFSLGQGYLAPSPEQVAADYISKQTALLSPSRDLRLSNIRNVQEQQGRGGLSVAQGGNLMATNPELAAYYNSIAQENLVLAAQADKEAQNRIKFGAGLFDTGAGLQGKYYAGQTAAYSPFTTAMDTSTGLESLAQVPLTLSTQIGAKTTASAADVGRLTGQGIINAAGTMAPSDAYSTAGNVISGAAQSPVFASAVNKAFGNTQQSTQQQYTYDPVTKQFVPVQSSSVFV